MSRAYRITLKEGVSRTVDVGDCVSTTLQILDILPAAPTAVLIGDALEKRGFTVDRESGKANKKVGDANVEIDLTSGEVSARVDGEKDVNVEVSEQVISDRDIPGEDSRVARRAGELKDKAEKQAQEVEEAARKEITAKLARAIDEVTPDLDAVVKEVTSAALKTKARQMGEVKSIDEDPESGSMTIRIEV
jgi:hypothetical protein